MSSTHLVIVGGASLDTLHFAGRTARSAGGAGLYTALAARRAGARVRMVAPRPEPMPPELAPAAERLDWRGPAVAPGELPRFELRHHPDGRTEVLDARARAEAALGPADLPDDLDGELVFLIAMADPAQQLELLEVLRARGCRVASGAFPCSVERRPETVRRIFAGSDLFFCNEGEARGLFGEVEAARTAPGKLLFVTRGARGARVVQGDRATDVPGIEVAALDPTGAGDTFSGTTLALLERGLHPVEAARRAVAAAAEMVQRVGPEALLEQPPPPPPASDGRAGVDGRAIARIATVLRELGELEPFSFVGPLFPAPADPRALELFFAATLQQFGFWSVADGRYDRPMVATLGGAALKGSDFLWACFRRWLDEAPGELEPGELAGLGRERLAHRLRDDNGTSPLPELDRRLELTRAYGRDLAAMGASPATLVARANRSPRPVAALLAELDHVGGYKEDPLRKKSALLALVLRQRPEGFLGRAEGDELPPIVDYHVQRSCLRTGIVRVADRALRRRLESRELLAAADERAVREASYRAMRELVRVSGRTMAAVDHLFFRNRTRCPEMSEPECGVCPLDGVCAKEKALFQPVRRTTFY